MRYFCAVARRDSFTKAAEDEGISQPSLSEQIRKLEGEVGAPLFERLGRGVRLTEAGRVLLPQAQAILESLRSMRQSLEALQGVRGRLTVGCIPTITPYFLAPRLAEFNRLFPDVELRLTEDITARLVEKLQQGELDVAVASPPVQNPDVVCSELFRERILAAVPEGHRLVALPGFALTELRSERLLLLKEGHCFRDNAVSVCRRSGVRMESVFETDQFASIFALVGSGFGISLVPAMAAEQRPGCRFLPLDPVVFRRIGYLQIRRHFATPPRKAFTRWLRDIAGRLGEKQGRFRVVGAETPELGIGA